MTDLALHALPGRYAICRLSRDASLPNWLPCAGFVAWTRTAGELSVVCDETVVPDEATATRGWRGLAVDGTLAFDLVGVLARLTTTLAAAHVSVFAISTYDTDHLFVRDIQFDAAVAALRRDGYEVRQ